MDVYLRYRCSRDSDIILVCSLWMVKVYLRLARNCALQITQREAPDEDSYDLAVDFMLRDEIFMDQLKGLNLRQAILILLLLHSGGDIFLGPSVKKFLMSECVERAALGHLGFWAAEMIL